GLRSQLSVSCGDHARPASWVAPWASARQFGNIHRADIKLHIVARRLPLYARFLLDLGLLEMLRTLHLSHQFERSLARFSRYHHLDFQLIAGSHRRLNRDQMQPGRHYALQIFEYLGPGERLAAKQVVEKLG